MKIAIYGAGAIGGLIGAHLARTGEDVTLIARGPHLAAMRGEGPDMSAAMQRRLHRAPAGRPSDRERSRPAGLSSSSP